MPRSAQIQRKTGETDIRIGLTIEGSGKSTIATKIPFFDHMLTLFSRHSLVDLDVKADGDIDVDFHHTVEDTGIALGQAFAKALGDKSGIRRYGWAYVPMEDTLARVVVDFSGRPFLHYRAPISMKGGRRVGDFPFQLVEEFLRSFSINAGCNLHAGILYGRDAHHMAEAIFKGLAKAVDAACQIDPRVTGIPSTKGML
ncbi:MAG: imidazoleglycerol-phosphate dehydratase HisB [Chthoniobacteraceae bacterium]